MRKVNIAHLILQVSRECGECSKPIKKAKKALKCKCKVVLFCSHICIAASDHVSACGGKSPTVKIPENSSGLKELVGKLKKDLPADAPHLLDKLKGVKVKHLSDLRRLAEEGDPVAAYMIGCSFSLRLTLAGKTNKIATCGAMMPLEGFEQSVGETDKEAIKWFLKSAEGGMAEGMLSLAYKIWANNGLKCDDRVAFYWMAKAVETGELGDKHRQVLEEKSYLAREIEAVYLGLCKAARQRVGKFWMGGPNLGSLLLAARNVELRKFGSNTSFGDILFGSSWIKKIFSLIDSRQDLCPEFRSGRMDTCGPATDMVVSKKRNVVNTRFYQGEKEKSCMDLEKVNSYNWESEEANQRSKYAVYCTHHKQLPLAVGMCVQCKEDAKQRTAAVAQGLYSISLTEAIPDYGHAARFTTEKGKIRNEVFKSYSKPEISCFLQCFSSNPADLHPLFLAEDQTIYWNIIWFFGSVYEAVLECCGEKVVKKVFGKLKQYRSKNLAKTHLPCGPLPLDVAAAFPASAVGEMRIACGNENCPNLDHEKRFEKCTGCMTRRYCSQQCLDKDWSKHDVECKKMHPVLPEVD